MEEMSIDVECRRRYNEKRGGKMDKLDLILEKQEKLDAGVEELKTEVAKTNLTIENEIKPQINLLAEGQGTLLAKLAPHSEVEELKEKMELLEAIVRANTREIEALKKAQ